MEVLKKARNTIGIAPITNLSIFNEIKMCEQNNKISKGNNFNEKKEIVIKHMVQQWTKNNLEITDEEWDNIEIIEVRQQSTDSDIIYLKCTNTDEIAKITSKAHNLNKNSDENPPRLVQFVPYEARDRYNAMCNKMKGIRKDNLTKGRVQKKLQKYGFC